MGGATGPLGDGRGSSCFSRVENSLAWWWDGVLTPPPGLPGLPWGGVCTARCSPNPSPLSRLGEMRCLWRAPSCVCAVGPGPWGTTDRLPSRRATQWTRQISFARGALPGEVGPPASTLFQPAPLGGAVDSCGASEMQLGLPGVAGLGQRLCHWYWCSGRIFFWEGCLPPKQRTAIQLGVFLFLGGLSLVPKDLCEARPQGRCSTYLSSGLMGEESGLVVGRKLKAVRSGEHFSGRRGHGTAP